MTTQINTLTHKRKVASAAIVVCLAFFGLVYGFAFPTAALAWDNCPRGLVNDPYPGICSRYVDTNGDDICDLSQSEPVASTTTTSLVTTTTTEKTAPTTTLAAATTTSGEPPTGDCPLGPCLGCGACFQGGLTSLAGSTVNVAYATEGGASAGAAVLLAATGTAASTSTTTPSSGGSDNSTPAVAAKAATVTQDSGDASFLTHYLVSPIALGFFLIYAASFALYKTKRIRITTHRKIWNVLLLGTFLVTGLFGVILAIQLDYTLPFTIPINLLFWHVEAGIAMTLISLFHMGWHFNYYKNLVRSSRSKVRAARAAERAFAADERQLVMEARAARCAEREARRTKAALEHAAARQRESMTPSP